MALLLQLTQALSQGFTAFWTRYPRREARKDAIKAWGQVVKDDPETEALIHAALDWQVPLYSERERQYIPLPATYIRGERWTDEPPTKAPTKLPAFVKADVSQFEDQRRRTQEAYRLMADGMSREQAMTQAFRKD